MSKEALNVFISHSSHDKDLADYLIRDLQAQGVQVWSDKNIAAGADWASEIQMALERARVYVFLLSPQFLESRWRTSSWESQLAEHSTELVFELFPCWRGVFSRTNFHHRCAKHRRSTWKVLESLKRAGRLPRLPGRRRAGMLAHMTPNNRLPRMVSRAARRLGYRLLAEWCGRPLKAPALGGARARFL